MTTPTEVLEAAADLLERPGAWTQGGFAHDRDGKEVAWDSSEAVCWCARGAIAFVAREYRAEVLDAIWDGAAKAMGFRSYGDIECWNDVPDRTQAEVVDALRQASRRGGEA